MAKNSAVKPAEIGIGVDIGSGTTPPTTIEKMAQRITELRAEIDLMTQERQELAQQVAQCQHRDSMLLAGMEQRRGAIAELAAWCELLEGDDGK